jgi:hypothetical protein
LTSKGVEFHASRAQGSIAVARLERGDDRAHVELSFDLTFTDEVGRIRHLVGSASTPTPSERSVDATPTQEPEVEVGVATGCDGSKTDPGYVDDDRSVSDDSTGCEGEPGPGLISDSSG